MSLISTSETWTVERWNVGLDLGLDDVSFDADPDRYEVTTGTIQGLGARGEMPGEGLSHLTRFSATFTTDEVTPFEFHIGACGEAAVIVNGEEIGRLDSSTLPGAATATCPATGASVCLCQTQNQYDIEDFLVNLPAGEHTLEIVYLAHPASNGIAVDWTPGDVGRQSLDLTLPEAVSDVDAEGDGEWGEMLDWPLIPIHSIVLPDGNILTFGTNEQGVQGAQFVYDVYNPITNTHFTLPNTAGTDIFCSQMVIDPSSGNIILMGGDTRGDPDLPGVNKGVDDITIFNTKTYTMESAPEDLEFERWYASVMTLSDGTMLTVGGSNSTGATSTIPEIYDSQTGETRALTGANMPSINRNYPHMWENSEGEIIIIEVQGREMFRLDTEGTGSVTKIGTLPFNTNWLDPSIMIGKDEVLMVDRDGGLWEGDISGSVPSFVKTAQLPAGRTNGNFSLTADGSVIITGGTEDNSTGSTVAALNQAQKAAIKYDPDTNEFEVLASEELGRLYHSTGTTLPDGRILSAGGGAPGPLKNLNAQIFRPDNHFDAEGNLAVRPEITDAPSNIDSGSTFQMDVSNALEIESVGAVRSGGISHSTNTDGRYLELEFKIIDTNTIEVTTDPGSVMLPGLWMVSVTDAGGVPSVSALMGVDMAPIGPADVDIAFETTVTVRFDDLGAGADQTVFDFGTGAGTDGITLTQNGTSGDIIFTVNDGATPFSITASGAIVEGEIATFTTKVDDDGLMQLYKNGSLIAQGPGAVPADVVRDSMLVGRSNTEGDTPLVGEVLFIEHSDVGGEIITEPETDLVFEATATVRFDDLDGGDWQRVFDFGNGPASDNILLTQAGGSNDMTFHVYDGWQQFSVTAEGAIVEGEVATWTAAIDSDGLMQIYKNGDLLAEGEGIVPPDVDRASLLIGRSNWTGDAPLIGEVLSIDFTDVGGEIIEDPDTVFEATATVRFDDLDGGNWQRVFDFGNGPGADNILLGQQGSSNDMTFHVYDGGRQVTLTAQDAIVEGETATWTAQIDETGMMQILKDGEVLAEGPGIVPSDVARESMLVGRSNWSNNTPLIGEVISISHTDVGGEITEVGETSFEATALVRFDDLDAGAWQRVFDFGNGPAQDNILLTQQGASNNMTFQIHDGGQMYAITAEGAITEGEVAKWSAAVDENGLMQIFKDDALVAEGQGVAPTDVVRENLLVGRSNWPNDTPLVGEVIEIGHSDVGGEIVDDPEMAFEVTATVRFDDLEAGDWQRVFDYGNGPGADNILMGQQSGSDNMTFHIYQAGEQYVLTAPGAIVEGETATWSVQIDETGFMEMSKDGDVLAQSQGVVPADIVRVNELVGQSAWSSDTPLVGEVLALDVDFDPDVEVAPAALPVFDFTAQQVAELEAEKEAQAEEDALELV
jgi:hypothetical protein